MIVADFRKLRLGFRLNNEEEYPMTLQVAFVGTDGVVLASDTKWQETLEIRTTFNRSKILIHHERRIAVSFARTMKISEQVAKAVIHDLTDKEWAASPEFRIQMIAESALKKASQFARDINCLIISPAMRLYPLRTERDDSGADMVFVDEHGDKAIAGDTQSTAAFFGERYYRRLPIHELAPLAAYSIRAGNSLSSATIDGLEVVLCETSGFHRLSVESVSGLQSMADRLDEHMRTSLVGHSDQFTYAPDLPG